MNVLLFLLGASAGFLLAWFLKKPAVNSLHAGDYESLKAEISSEREKVLSLTSSLAGKTAALNHLEEKLKESNSALQDLNKKLTSEFENIAARLLEEKSQKFTQQNKTNLDILLSPLQDKIKTFSEMVEKSYRQEASERNSLRGEINSLINLNRELSQEAGNLARALKGDSKTQGNWGEVILEKILERSGLVKDQEYKMQYSTLNDQGRRIQPDAIIFLPDNKHVIVDSKVSLVAYESFVNASGEEEKKNFIRQHLASIRNHVKSLAEKNYQSAGGLHSPDFVLLFLPIESSFGVAVQEDQELFGYAWERKIVIVSPSTLFATLRTIASIWNQERQNRNVLEIARQSGDLYDKFVGFTEDLIALGNRMNSAKQAYDSAMGKLSEGKGNLVGRTEKIRELGARASKTINPQLVERSAGNENLPGNTTE